MSKQTINIGASPNDGTGTPLRTSFDYTNQNFTELYTALGGGVGLPGATTQVIFNDGGTNLAGDAGLVYNKTTDALTVAGLVTAGSATITGAATVTGAANLNGAVNLSTSGTPTVTLGATATYGVLVGSGTNAASIYINGATRPGFNAVLQFGAAEHQFYNSSLSSLIATLNTTALGIGVAPVAGRGAIQLSAGVGFPATQVASADANTLDDYEEGTWTPVLTFATPGTLAVTYNGRSGTYTKIGNLVTVIFRVSCAAAGIIKGTASGGLSITGLPFTVGSAYSYSYVDLGSAITDITTGSCALMIPLTTSIAFETLAIVGTRIERDSASLTAANFAASNGSFVTIAGTITYTA